jgi:4-carboxymuconolactone decarboxylase
MTDDPYPQAAAARQPRLRPADLSDAQRALYDAIVGGPRSGGAFALTDADGVLEGPFGGFLLSPALGDALQQLGAAIRYRSDLTPRVRELAILAVAAHHQSLFERYAHEAVGRAVGLSGEEMAAIWAGADLVLADPGEAAALAFAKAVLAGDVDNETWTACVPPLGVGVAYEILVLVGYYSTLALQMRVLRTDRGPA